MKENEHQQTPPENPTPNEPSIAESLSPAKRLWKWLKEVGTVKPLEILPLFDDEAAINEVAELILRGSSPVDVDHLASQKVSEHQELYPRAKSAQLLRLKYRVMLEGYHSVFQGLMDISLDWPNVNDPSASLEYVTRMASVLDGKAIESELWETMSNGPIIERLDQELHKLLEILIADALPGIEAELQNLQAIAKNSVDKKKPQKSWEEIRRELIFSHINTVLLERQTEKQKRAEHRLSEDLADGGVQSDEHDETDLRDSSQS